METFLEYLGAKMGTNHKKMAGKHTPFKTDGTPRKTGGGIADPNKTGLVAHSRKHDPTLNPKVERLRQGQSTMEVLSNADVQQITAAYGITGLDQETPKTLSNMNITIAFNPELGAFTLTTDKSITLNHD